MQGCWLSYDCVVGKNALWFDSLLSEVFCKGKMFMDITCVLLETDVKVTENCKPAFKEQGKW